METLYNVCLCKTVVLSVNLPIINFGEGGLQIVHSSAIVQRKVGNDQSINGDAVTWNDEFETLPKNTVLYCSIGLDIMQKGSEY